MKTLFSILFLSFSLVAWAQNRTAIVILTAHEEAIARGIVKDYCENISKYSKRDDIDARKNLLNMIENKNNDVFNDLASKYSESQVGFEKYLQHIRIDFQNQLEVSFKENIENLEIRAWRKNDSTDNEIYARLVITKQTKKGSEIIKKPIEIIINTKIGKIRNIFSMEYPADMALLPPMQLYRLYEDFARGVNEKKITEKNAILYLQKAAERGYADAQYELGFLLRTGSNEHIKKNEKDAVKWWQKAALREHEKSLGILAKYYKTIKKYEEAYRSYEKLASLDNFWARNELGILLYEGIGCKADTLRAFTIFKSIADVRFLPIPTFEQITGRSEFIHPDQKHRTIIHWIGAGLRNMGHYYKAKQQYDSAYYYYVESTSFCQEGTLKLCYSPLIECYLKGLGVSKDTLMAIRLHEDLIEDANISVTKQLTDESSVCIEYINILMLLKNGKRQELFIQYVEKALKNLKYLSSKMSILELPIHNIMGEFSTNKRNTYLQSFLTRYYDSIMHYENLKDAKYAVMIVNVAMGMQYSVFSQPSKSVEYFKKALACEKDTILFDDKSKIQGNFVPLSYYDPSGQFLTNEVSTYIKTESEISANRNIKTTIKKLIPNTIALLASAYKDIGNYAEALKCYHELVNRGHFWALEYIGDVYNAQGNYSEAEKWYLKAIQVGDKKAYYALAMLYHKQKRYSEAEKCYLVAIDNGIANAIYALGVVYFDQKNYVEAEKWYLRAVDNKVGEAIVGLANLYSSQGKYTEAEKLYRQAIDLGDVSAMFNLAVSYDKRKNMIEAEKWYLKAAENGHTGAMFNIASIYKSQKKYIEAEKWYLKAVEVGKDIDAMYNLAILYQEKEQYISAAKWYLKALENGIVKSCTNLGYVYMAMNMNGDAQKYFLKAIENNDLRGGCIGLGSLFEGQKNYIEAEKWYLKAQTAGYQKATYYLGRVLELQNKYTEAASYYVKYINEGYENVCFEAAICYIMANDFGKADEYSSRYIRLKPNNPEGYYLKALATESYDPKMELGVAKPNHEKFISLTLADPQAPQNKDWLKYSHLYLAQYYQKQGNKAKAKAHYQEVLRYDPQNAQALEALQ